MARRSTASRQYVQSSSAIPKWGRMVNAASKRAVAAGARAGRDEARRHVPIGDGVSGVSARKGSPLPAHARDSIETLPIGKIRRGGWRAAFGSADPTILWLDQGTLGRRTKRLVTNGRSREINREIRRKFLRQTKDGRSTGLRPRRFMVKANRVALKTSIDTLKREAGRKTRLL